MTELLAIAGAALLALALVIAGGIAIDIGRDKKCKAGEPVVIEAKVYRCVESK